MVPYFTLAPTGMARHVACHMPPTEANNVYVSFNFAPPLFIQRLSAIADNKCEHKLIALIFRFPCGPSGLYLP
ncbi:Uncharacterised protein [Serratia entomophila]|nr:Uncharacterised protein [Serratia entomophila]